MRAANRRYKKNHRSHAMVFFDWRPEAKDASGLLSAHERNMCCDCRHVKRLQDRRPNIMRLRVQHQSGKLTMTMISATTGSKRYFLTAGRIRQLAAAGLGRKQENGQWEIDEAELARHCGVPVYQPPDHEVVGAMLIESGRALQSLSRDFPDLFARTIKEMFLRGNAASEGAASEKPTTQ
jgi:hypothetical protein